MANFNRYQTMADLVNRVAVGVGLRETGDPFSKPDPSYKQLTTLANEVGMDLLPELPWNRMERTEKFTTQVGDTGIYDLVGRHGSLTAAELRVPLLVSGG